MAAHLYIFANILIGHALKQSHNDLMVYNLIPVPGSKSSVWFTFAET